MSSDHIPFGSPDPFLACEEDIDVDAERSLSHASFVSVGNSNSTMPAVTNEVPLSATCPSHTQGGRKRARRECCEETRATPSLTAVAEIHQNEPTATQPPSLPPPPPHAHRLQAEKTSALHPHTVPPSELPSARHARRASVSDVPALVSPALAATQVPGTAKEASGDASGTVSTADLQVTNAATSTSCQLWALLADVYAAADQSTVDGAPPSHEAAGDHKAAKATTADPSTLGAALTAHRRATLALSYTAQHTLAFLVSDAFHVALWYVLRCAGPSLPVPMLVAVQAILALSPSAFSSSEDERCTPQEATVSATGEGADDALTDPLARLEATELLLRLALRSALSFTQAHLDVQYGDHLHVQRALRLLCQTSWKGEPDAAAEQSAESLADCGDSGSSHHTAASPTPQHKNGEAKARTADTQTPVARPPQTLLRHYDGRRVSALMTALHPVALRFRAGRGASVVASDGVDPISAAAQVDETETGRELLELMYAVRVRELRTLAFALYYHYHPSAAPPSASGVNTRSDADGRTSAVADEEATADTTSPARGRRSARTPADVAGADAAAASSLIPTRKRDILQYLIERRFCEHLPSGMDSAACGPSDVENVVAAHWQLYVGSLYTVPPSLRRCVGEVAELFQAMTGNFAAGGTLATMASGGAAAAAAAPSLAVAVPPALLFVRPQLLFMVSHARYRLARAMVMRRLTAVLDSPLLPFAPASATPLPKPASPPSSSTSSWLPLWWWSQRTQRAGEVSCHSNTATATALAGGASPPSSMFSSRTPTLSTCTDVFGIACQRPDLLLFPTPKALQDYQEALHAQQNLFLLTEARASAPPKQQLKDATTVRGWYEDSLSAINRLKRESARAPVAQGLPQPPSMTIPEVLRLYGLFASHLLQFLPIYRWFAYLERLVPVLQSCHLYTEANVCLRILTEEPLYTLTPPAALPVLATSGPPCATARRPRLTAPVSAATRATSAAAANLAAFHIFYRPEKHGEWRHRLALNLSHLQQHQEAVQVLEDAHARWYPFWVACSPSAQNRKADHAREHTTTTTTTTTVHRRTTAKKVTRASAPAPSDTSLRALLAYLERLTDRLTPHHSVHHEPSLLTSSWRQSFALQGSAPSTAPIRTDEPDDVTLLAQLPAEVQRRCRLLRSTFPLSHDMAAFHAVMEYLLPRYCRRADRLTQEKSLKHLYRRLRKWTPFPSEYAAFSSSVADVPEAHFPGCRDALDPQLWRAPPRGASSHTHARMRPASAKPAHSESCDGSRDVMDETTRDVQQGAPHNGSSAAPAGVEEFVLRVSLETWNSAAAQQPLREPEHLRVQTVRKRPRSATVRHARTTSAQPDDGAPSAVSGGAGRPLWGPWRGLHCEGAWIAFAARALLWDCIYAPLRAAPTDTAEAVSHTASSGASSESDPHYTWLSPFQEAPLDMLSSVQFCVARRRLIEERLAYLEMCTKSGLLALVAARIRNDGGRQAPLSTTTLVAAELGTSTTSHRAASPDGRIMEAGTHTVVADHPMDTHASDEEADEDAARQREAAAVELDELVLLTDGDSNSFCAPPSLSNASSSAVHCLSQPHDPTATTTSGPADGDASVSLPNNHSSTALTDQVSAIDRLTHALAQGELSDHFRVDLAGFPLMDLLRAVPQKPLLRLLRHLFLEPFSEGYGVKFSGFPDLVFWRTALSDEGRHAGDDLTGRDVTSPEDITFRLMEVKSPSDVLSTKQMNVNDCLQRCGFCVEVAKVDEVKDDGSVERRGRTSVPSPLNKRPATRPAAKPSRAQPPRPASSRAPTDPSARGARTRPSSSSQSSQEVIVL